MATTVMVPLDVPPGLTCTACQRPFDRALATWTPDGWRHVGRCPRRRAGAPLAIEDVEWLVITGECLSMAARRLGFTTHALDIRLRRAGRVDLLRALTEREGDWNNPAVIRRTERKAS